MWPVFYSGIILKLNYDLLLSVVTGQEVRWNFIHGLFELAIYGGRVDNPFDTSVMVSYLEQFFDQNVLAQGAKHKRLGPLHLPTSTNYRVCLFYDAKHGILTTSLKNVFIRLGITESADSCKNKTHRV